MTQNNRKICTHVGVKKAECDDEAAVKLEKAALVD